MADPVSEQPRIRRGPKLRPRESQAPDPERICKRADQLLNRRANVDTLQQELADYIVPRKAVITEKRAFEGEELTERVWRSIPIRANELLTARMQSALTSPSVRWFSLKTRDEEVNDMYSVKEWLAAVENRVYLAMRQSNFNQEIAEVFLDLGAFGIGALLIEENPKEIPGFNGLLFVALAPGTYSVAEAATGEVNTLYRYPMMTIAQCVEKFGLDALPESWRELYKTNPDAEKDLIHAIEPRHVDNPRRKDTLHMRWSSVWVARQEKTILLESGYHEFPAIIPRWSKTSGEVYGRGPGHTALPDIRTLNRCVELGLQALAKAIDPPGLTSSDATIAELDMRPGSQNTVDGDPARAWKPLESGARFDVAHLYTENLENDIRNVFYWDQLQLTTDRQMTLGEVQRRLELMQQFLAPVLARLESEGLAPLLNRCFGLMWRGKALPPPPPELQGQNLDIEYEGPLARSQKATRLAGFEEFIRLTAPIEARNLAVADNLDDDYAYRDIGEVAGLPTKYFRDESERDNMRTQRQAKQQADQAMERATQAADAAGKLAPVLGAMNEQQANGGGGQPGAGAPDMQQMMQQMVGQNGRPPA